ncbi:MAG TPA: transglycosylase domain-containing protein [Solirubrobacterales bacterium]|nr:transglycosylase domain-containing protein [Solirubrobacterales bacterium]
MSARSRRRHRRTSRKKNPFLVALGVTGSIVAIGVLGGGLWLVSVYDSAPSIASLRPISKGTVSKVYAANGSLLGVIHSDNIRQPVGSARIPQDLKDATVAIEDRRFFDHGGIDPSAIVRAGWEDLVAGGKPVEGGSTITQQLVRNLYIEDPEDTLHRKIIEAHLANDMEDQHTKDWILTEYLNTASYGTNNGATAIGVEAAAETYYSKHARDLTLPEAAMIAGLPQAPSQYNPLLNPRAALARRNEVLHAMQQQGMISQSEYEDVLGQGLGLIPGQKYTRIRDPYIFDLVKQELEDRYGLNTVQNGGLKVYTTIEPRLQTAAQSAVDSCSVCYSGGPASALASVDPTNGKIVALASTQRYSPDSQFNFAAHAQRQPGSSFKTYVLTAAIREGIDPDSTYYDGSSPKTLETPGGGTWTVNNAEPGGGGTLALTQATWESVNVVFAQLGLDVGPESFAKTAYDMGITSPLGIKGARAIPCKLGPNCFIPPADAIGGLTLGVTPLEQANAYATLANGGIRHDPTAIDKVVFPGGKVDEPSSDEGKRVLTEGQAYEVTKVLEGVITSGTGAGYTYMGCSSEAGKTGTSEDLSDAWFVGYTPKYSTAVWTGHPLSRDYTGFGGPTSGPVWRSFMEAAQGSDCPDFEVPSSLPSLSSYHGEHTASSSSYCSSSSSYSCSSSSSYSPSSGDSSDDSGSGGSGGDNSDAYAPGVGQKPAPSPKPKPTPVPAPPPAAPPPSGGVNPG